MKQWFGQKSREEAPDLMLMRGQTVRRVKTLAENPVYPSERRCWPREKTFRYAEIYFSSREMIECEILDKSYDGVRIKLRDYIEVPERFRLSIPTLGFDEFVDCKWQVGVTVGVSLTVDEEIFPDPKV